MTVLVHGFWGQPRDWAGVVARLPLGCPVLCPDLYESGDLSPRHTLPQWIENFWHFVDAHAGPNPIQLVGYSLGGRLALNALVAWPEKVSRALLLSTQAFLPKAEVMEREKFETHWAQAFARKPWVELESEWQEQNIFAGSKSLSRRQGPALREILGLSLTHWSPRHHVFGLHDLRELPWTVEWAFGATDQKYLNIAKTLQDLPVRGQITILPQAGHRLIDEAGDFVVQWIQNGRN